jgi:RimJ/RimL family protein N-acetyltransferase
VPIELDGLDLSTVVLRTERLVLRPWRPDDVDEVTRAHQDAEMLRWLPVPAPYTRDDAAALIARTTAAREERTGLLTVVEADGQLVGSAGLHFPQTLLGPMIGYWTAPWGRGRGYAVEAAAALTEWAFTHGAHRVQLMADVDNLPSQEVAHKAGFREEGRVRAVLPYRDGRYGDAVLFARLPSDPAPR